MKINTEEQRQALRLTLKATARKPLNKRQLASILTKGEEPVYKQTGDAANFIRSALESEELPLTYKNGKICRKDLGQEVAV